MGMSDRDLLELIAAKVVGLETKVEKMSIELQTIQKTVINIENDHGEKLTALFDGYYQHTDMLERIKQEVSRQEEVVLRKIQ